jgi:sortase A
VAKLFSKYSEKPAAIIIISLFSLSLWQLFTAGWIQGKAIIAQQLLGYSWHQTINETQKYQNDNATHKTIIKKPWPWSDTWPVAKLMVPQYNIEQIVLAGDSGSSLAFGPGYSFASARPNTAGLTMISGHRDTHFSFLKDLKLDDNIYLQTANETITYQVYDLQIVNSKTFALASDNNKQTLVLVTCYPFDAITSGGSLRYIVYARNQ